MMYSHDTETVFNAFAKAFESALANYEAASALADQNHISQASSLAILSLEEVGKMMLLDGLLFAKTGDERYKLYKQGHLSHRMKLDAVEFYPFFLHYLTTIDPRQNESRYKQTMLLVITDLKARRQELADLLGEDFVFPDLDRLKQQGFYSHEVDGVLKANKEAIDPKVAKALLALTWRVTDTLKFVLGRSLEHYKAFFQDIREKMDEVSLKGVRNETAKVVGNLFGIDVEKP
jgi:AbiV family abortive infection protein